MKHTRHEIKKIGFYDSGIGGLFLMSHVRTLFPGYEYVFLGDEKNLPYGSKSSTELIPIARHCIEYLFEQEHCDVVVIACNTMSAVAYPTLSAEYAQKYKDKLLIDIITPTVDMLDPDTVFSVFGTERTITSHLYRDSIIDRFPDTAVHEYEAKELAPLIEAGTDVTTYLESFKKNIHPANHTCILACTHYGVVLDTFQKVFPQFGPIICQHTVIVDLLKFILHQDAGASQNLCTVYTTKHNAVFTQYCQTWFPGIPVRIIDILDK